MEYRSPIRLVTHVAEPVDSYSPQVLHRARKKLLAEISLQNNEIVLDDVTYMRNDVITLFDSITDENVWKYHCMVYAHQPLLDFLEFEVFDNEGLRAAEGLKKNEGFVSFIAPYFAHSFNAISGCLIRLEDYEGLACLMNYQAFVGSMYKHEAFQRIRIYLDELTHFLKNLSWDKFSGTQYGPQLLVNGNWVSFINKLPDEFDAMRDALVSQMLTVIERFQRKASWEYLHDCCLGLQYVECSATYKSEVDRFEQIIGNNAKRHESGSKNNSSSSPGRILFTIIWIIFIIVRAANSCDRGSSYNSSSNVYSINPDDFKIQTSSLLKEIDYSKNEKAFKAFLNTITIDSSDINKDKMPKWLVPVSGKEAFKNITLPFNQVGKVDVTIVNNTDYDCILFYFEVTDDALIWKEHKPMAYSAYIKKNYSFNLHLNPDKGRFNLYFGKKWVQLKKPLDFQVKEYKDRDLNIFRQIKDTANYSITSSLSLPACFLPVSDLSQTYLTHDIMLRTWNTESSSEKIIHNPDSSITVTDGQYRMKLNFTSINNEIKMEAQGNVYLTLSQ